MLPNSNRHMSPLPGEPEPFAGDSDDLPLSDDAREALLRRLEAWIDEEERLIADIERRTAVGDVTPFKRAPSSEAGGADGGQVAGRRRIVNGRDRSRAWPGHDG
jgi:hypothetical protein